MKRIKFETRLTQDELAEALSDPRLVSGGFGIPEEKGRPVLHIKRKGDRLKVKCELVGGVSRDNGFLEGTAMYARLKEKNGMTVFSGIIVTAPIYHTALLLLFLFFIYRCVSLGGFNPTPVILLFFSIFLFKTEFRKQGIIYTAVRRLRSLGERR